MIGFDGTELSNSVARTLRSIQPNGTILFKRNIADAQQTHALNRAIFDALRVPPFLGVDLEGGTVDRLRAVVAHAPDVASVASTGQKKEFERHGELIGQEVRALGFNVDFAPVLDIGFEPSRKVMTSRTASSDPRKVTQFAQAFL